MGIPKHLEARLARLEARRESRRNPTMYELGSLLETEGTLQLYYGTWADGGSLEDLPKRYRNPEMWNYTLHFGTLINGGSLEDIPEEDRNPKVWDVFYELAPPLLSLSFN